MKPATTPIAYSVHRAGTSPMASECATQVSVDDDGGGAYIVLRQLASEDAKPGEVRLDLEELEAVLRAARRLIRAQPEVTDE